VSDLERPVQILGGATVQALHHAVTIETTVARPLSTGTVAASTRADLTTSRSIGWVSRWTLCPQATETDGASGSSVSGFRC